MCQCTPTLRTPWCGRPGCGSLRTPVADRDREDVAVVAFLAAYQRIPAAQVSFADVGEFRRRSPMYGPLVAALAAVGVR